MTHTLHRLGNIENLQEDYVVFAMSAKGINEEGSRKAMRRFMEMAFELDPANAGDTRTGHVFTLSREDILEGIQDISVVHFVFTDEEKVATLLKRVCEAELGISVVVSGLFDEVRECCHKAGLRQHTVECSLGVWGKTERLPAPQVMQITTMCGHGLIAASKVERLARDVRRDRITSEEAAHDLAQTCICGIFNPVRAAHLLESIASGKEPGNPVAAGQTIA